MPEVNYLFSISWGYIKVCDCVKNMKQNRLLWLSINLDSKFLSMFVFLKSMIRTDNLYKQTSWIIYIEFI